MPNEMMEKSTKRNPPVRVVVLHDEGCPSTPKTIEWIEACTAEMGIEIDFQILLVTTLTEANKWRFLGSPTIQVNGMDIDPSVRDAKAFGFL
jgi:hypothetical protein